MIELKSKFGKVYYTATYDQNNDYAHTQWIGFVPSEEAIKGVEATLQVIEQSGTRRLLSDNSQIKGAWGETNDWLEKNWFAKASALSLQKHATILPSDMFAKSSHEQFEKTQAGNTIQMMNFENVEEAMKWLAQG